MSGAFFQSGAFDLKIEDEAGKIPLNKLVAGNEYNAEIQDVLLRFFELPDFDLDEQQVRDIVDAIKDWIDEDDEITGFGAENAYYQGLDSPRQADADVFPWPIRGVSHSGLGTGSLRPAQR